MGLEVIITNQRTKTQSRQWVGPGFPMPKKTQPSAAKAMAKVIKDAKGVIMLVLCKISRPAENRHS